MGFNSGFKGLRSLDTYVAH